MSKSENCLTQTKVNAAAEVVSGGGTCLPVRPQEAPFGASKGN